MRVGLVATQFPGVTHAGGISPPTDRLARALAAQNGSCTVLLPRIGRSVPIGLKRTYAKLGIDLVDLQGKEERAYPWWMESHLLVRRTVEGLDLDRVVVQDWQGLGVLLSVGPPVCGAVTTWIHGGELYDLFGAGRTFQQFYGFIDTELERTQIQSSASVVSPSAFLIEWYRRQGWPIEEGRSLVIPYLMGKPRPEEVYAGSSGRPPAIVFIGKLSRRKGIDRFVEILEDNRHHAQHVVVKVFGGQDDIPPRKLEEQIRQLGYDTRIETEWSTSRIWESLADHTALLMCPSRLDNSPNVVYEAAVRGHHSFVWPDNGAAELEALFPGLVHRWSSFDDALAIATGESSPLPNVDLLNDSILDQWLQLLMDQTDERTSGRTSEVPAISSAISTVPLVSIVIASRNRVGHLAAAIQSMAEQDFSASFEIIVVDDASDQPYSEGDLPSIPPHIHLRIERNDRRRGPGGSRNLGTRIARGTLLLFADDDNLLRSNHLSSILHEYQRSGADVVVPGHTNHTTDGVLTPDLIGTCEVETLFLGDHLLPLGYLVNTIGDTNFLIRREVFESLSGWDETWPNALEDWELLSRVIAHGHRVVGTLTPTVAYRRNSTGVQASNVDGFAYRRLDIAASLNAPGVHLHTLALARAAYMTHSTLTPRALSMLARRTFNELKSSPLRTTGSLVKTGAKYARRHRRLRRA